MRSEYLTRTGDHTMRGIRADVITVRVAFGLEFRDLVLWVGLG